MYHYVSSLHFLSLPYSPSPPLTSIVPTTHWTSFSSFLFLLFSTCYEESLFVYYMIIYFFFPLHSLEHSKFIFSSKIFPLTTSFLSLLAGKNFPRGLNITTFPAVLTNSKSTVIYEATSALPHLDNITYTATCGGVAEEGKKQQMEKETERRWISNDHILSPLSFCSSLSVSLSSSLLSSL